MMNNEGPLARATGGILGGSQSCLFALSCWRDPGPADFVCGGLTPIRALAGGASPCVASPALSKGVGLGGKLFQTCYRSDSRVHLRCHTSTNKQRFR
eukprot:4438583-Prymnesium_polylepis.1